MRISAEHVKSPPSARLPVEQKGEGARGFLMIEPVGYVGAASRYVAGHTDSPLPLSRA